MRSLRSTLIFPIFLKMRKIYTNSTWIELFLNNKNSFIPTIRCTHSNYSDNNLHFRLISHIFQHVNITSQPYTVIGRSEMYQHTVFHISFIFTNEIDSTSKDQAAHSVTKLFRLSHILHDSRHEYTVIFDTQKIKSNTRYTLVLFNWWKTKFSFIDCFMPIFE